MYLTSIISLGTSMFTPLPAEKHNPITPVRITRNNADTGWMVHGSHARAFMDCDYEYSRNNSFVQAVVYSETMVANSKRAWSTNRNFVLVEKPDRRKQLRLYVRITRPTGGYKFFLVERQGLDAEFHEIREAVSQAVSWFYKERAACEDVITSKNIATKNKRKSERRSLLYGGFIPGPR